MLDLFGNHIVGFPTWGLKCAQYTGNLPLGNFSRNGISLKYSFYNIPLIVEFSVKSKNFPSLWIFLLK